MPVLGNRPLPDRNLWQSASTKEITEVIGKLAVGQGNLPLQIVECINEANAALNAFNDGGEAFMAYDLADSQYYFAIGPRFVPEGEMEFSLEKVIDDAAGVLMGALEGTSTSDERLSQAAWAALIDEGLIEGELFDSYSSFSDFSGVVARGFEKLEDSLEEGPLMSDDESGESSSGP